MPSWKDFYGSNYISSKTMNGKAFKAKILAVAPETMNGTDGKSTTRLCCTLQGQDKLLPLNATNVERIAKRFGDDYDKWKGKMLSVGLHKTQYKGNEVDGLLITPV